MAGIVRQSLGEFFVGQGDMIYWDALASYDSKTIADFVNGKSFGNIKEDSTSWTGEDLTETAVRNEQGNPITTTTTAGTLSFECVLADFDNAIVKKLLKGADINIASVTPDWLASTGTKNAIGFGYELPTIICPVGISNETLNKTLIFPKAKISSNLVIEDKLLCIHMSISAQAIHTTSLATAMIVNGALVYDE